MINIKAPIFWAKLIQGSFFALMLLLVALRTEESLFLRGLYGVFSLALIYSAIKQLRSPDVEEVDPTVSILLVSLLYIVFGGCAFAFEFNSSKLLFTDLLREPEKFLVLGLLPVGLVTFALSIMEIYSNK
jgi:hypothetical protein